MIFVVDDDEIMRECIVRACGEGVQVRGFANAVEAMNAIADGELPELIFLDILLDGPDGFTFLNEMVSYGDTARVPVVVVTSLDMTGRDLSAYGVVGVLMKDSMKPTDVWKYVQRYIGEQMNVGTK